jgi:hypothetical protein
VDAPFRERRRSSAQKSLSETSVMKLPKANSLACFPRWDRLPRCFCRLTGSPVARGDLPSSRSQTRQRWQTLSSGLTAKSSTAGIFVSPRPKTARAPLRGVSHLPGTAHIRSHGQRGVGGTSGARSGASRQTARCRIALGSYTLGNPGDLRRDGNLPSPAREGATVLSP